MSSFHAGRRKMNNVRTGLRCWRECLGTLRISKQMVVLLNFPTLKTKNCGLLVSRQVCSLSSQPPLASISCYPQLRPPPPFLLPFLHFRRPLPVNQWLLASSNHSGNCLTSNHHLRWPSTECPSSSHQLDDSCHLFRLPLP